LLKEINTKIKKLKNQIQSLNDQKESLQKSINSTSIKGLENRLIEVMIDRITNADNFEALVQNNSVDMFYPLAKDLESKTKGTYDKYDRGPVQKKSKTISGTTIYDYRYNLRQHQENSVSKDALGIAAVMAMFHSMFTQMGATIPGLTLKQEKARQFYSKVLQYPASYSLDVQDQAIEFMNDVNAPYIRLAHNTVEEDGKIALNFGSRTNTEGKNISTVMGQLINGYVDAPSDAWIFNIQGNKENTPVLIFMALVGVPATTAVYFSSVDLIRKYNEIKAEMNGVYSNLTKNPVESPIIKATDQETSTIQLILDKAREEIFNTPEIKDVLLKTFGTEEVSLTLLNNLIEDDFTNDELYDMIDAENMYTLKQISALAHYIKLEEMSSDLTSFTQATKFATKKISTLTEASRRSSTVARMRQGLMPSIIPGRWFDDMEWYTNNGLFNNDNFTIDLISQYFPIRNHPNLTRLANKLKVPEQYIAEVIRSHFKNDFVSYLFQNSLFSNDTFNGFTIEESTDLSVASELDFENMTYTYNPQLLLEKIQREKHVLGSELNIELHDKFPTNMHYMRYDIEFQKLEEEVQDLTDEEILDRFYYMHDAERNILNADAVMKKVALYRSDNNIAMFDYRMGYVSILKGLLKKYPELSQQYALVKDLKNDYDESLRKQNFYLPLKNDPQAISRYKENLKNLQNHEVDEIAEFFKKFPIMALFQTGLNRTSKYDLARVGNPNTLYSVIEKGIINSEQIKILLDELNLTKVTMDNFISSDVAYLSEFASIFTKLLVTDEYKIRNKGVNYIKGGKNLVDFGVILNSGTFNNVRIIGDISQLEEGEYLFEVEDLFTQNNEVNVDNVNDLIANGFTMLNQKVVAEDPALQPIVDDLLLTKFGIDNSGSVPRRVALSLGQTEDNISIVTADKIREYYGMKDEAMANNSTIAIGQATQIKTPRLSSSQTYVNEINKKYPEKLATDKTTFKSTDKVWIFGSGLFKGAARGLEGASDKQRMEKLKEAITETFNTYHRPLIDKAIAAGVESFNVGIASGIDQMALGLLLNTKGYIPIVQYTTTGKYVQFIKEDNYQILNISKYNPDLLYDAKDKPRNITASMQKVLDHVDMEEMREFVKNASEKQLIENNVFQQVKDAINNTLNKLYPTPNELNFVKDELVDSFGRIAVGDDIFSSYVEKAIMQIRNQYAVDKLYNLGHGLPYISQKVYELNNVTINLSPDNEAKVVSNQKRSTLRSDKEAKNIGLKPGDISYTEYEGKKFQVSYHGLKSVQELGGPNVVAKSEGFPTQETETNKIPVKIGDVTYYVMFQQTANFLNGQGQLHWYTFMPVTNEIARTKVTPVVEGDIFALEGIPVITTNLGGVHGAGLAQAAKAKGLIKQGDGAFKATDKVVQLPVKKVWSDSMDINNNIELLKSSLKQLQVVARNNPNQVYLLPLAGLGHGEGSIETILPLLTAVVKNNPNVQLVLPAENVDLGRQGTVRTDRTKQNLPAIKALLSEEFPNFTSSTQSQAGGQLDMFDGTEDINDEDVDNLPTDCE
jgi:hypothetical protein